MATPPGNMKLILGSSSSGRQEILKRAGYEFEVIKPEIDEQAIRCNDPRELVLMLANAKADAILEKLGSNIDTNTIIIASDQVVSCNNIIIEKPKDIAQAKYFISQYHLYPAKVINGLVLVNAKTKNRVQGVDVSQTMLKEALSENLIEILINKDYTLHCSGGIRFEDPLIAPYIKFSDATEDKLKGVPLELFEKLLKEITA